MSAEEEDYSTFHEGEKQMQTLVLGKENAKGHQDEIKSFLRAQMPMQHRDFYAALPYLFLAYVDEQGFPWPTVLSHPTEPLFRSRATPPHSPSDSFYDAEGGRFSLLASSLHPSDWQAREVLLSGEEEPVHVGILGLDLANRRRNRVNAKLVPQLTSDGHLRCHVGLSFGNCPKYIQLRSWKRIAPETLVQKRKIDSTPSSSSSSTSPSSSSTPSSTQAFLEVVRRADTMFIASAHSHLDSKNRSQGVDISHRGGPPGFVQVTQGATPEDPLVLKWPDYVGNAFFNTLGNLFVNSKSGLGFPDFSNGDFWQVSGHSQIHQDDRSLPGAERTISFTVNTIRCLPAAFAVEFSSAPLEFSPFLPDPVAEPLQCVSIKAMGSTAHTYTFALKRPRRYLAGQYAVFNGRTPQEESWQRAWTISSWPQGGNYGDKQISITVKTKPGGRISPHLKEWLIENPSALSLAGAFQGEFSLFHNSSTQGFTLEVLHATNHVLLVAAGSGVTPMISQLGALSELRSQLEHLHVTLLYYSRNADEQIGAAQFRKLAQAWPKFHFLEAVTQPLPDSAPPHPSLLGGRPSQSHFLSVPDIAGSAPDLAMVCGPEGFMSSVTALLEAVWPSVTIKKESFTF